jgi:hypothetical protein
MSSALPSGQTMRLRPGRTTAYLQNVRAFARALLDLK